MDCKYWYKLVLEIPTTKGISTWYWHKKLQMWDEPIYFSESNFSSEDISLALQEIKDNKVNGVIKLVEVKIEERVLSTSNKD